MNIPSINEFVSPMETNPSMFSSRFRHRNNTNKSSIFLPFTGDVRDDPDYQLKIGRRRLAGSRLVYQSTDGILGTYSSREDQLKREQKQKLITLNRIISQQSQKVLGFGEFEEKPEIFSVESLREEVKEAEKSRQSERQVEDFFRKFRNARLYLDGIEASRTNQKSFDRIFNQERYEAMTKRLANNPERVKSYKEAVLRRIKAFTSPEIDVSFSNPLSHKSNEMSRDDKKNL